MGCCGQCGGEEPKNEQPDTKVEDQQSEKKEEQAKSSEE